jgi:hypothetical protein
MHLAISDDWPVVGRWPRPAGPPRGGPLVTRLLVESLRGGGLGRRLASTVGAAAVSCVAMAGAAPTPPSLLEALKKIAAAISACSSPTRPCSAAMRVALAQSPLKDGTLAMRATFKVTQCADCNSRTDRWFWLWWVPRGRHPTAGLALKTAVVPVPVKDDAWPRKRHFMPWMISSRPRHPWCLRLQRQGRQVGDQGTSAAGENRMHRRSQRFSTLLLWGRIREARSRV